MRNVTVLTAALLLISTGMAHADLEPRGCHMIYDTDLNITWLTEVDLAGPMFWAEADGDVSIRTID